MQSWNQHKQNKRLGISIENYLDPTRCKQIYNNRHYLKSVEETLLLTCHLEIVFRGNDESKSSLNRGIFLTVIAKHDPIVQDYIDKGPKHTTYLSPDIQNSTLQIMGKMIRGSICDEVRQAGYFSLMADETKDLSKQEQPATVLRYLDKEGAINEGFFTFVETTSLNAESLSNYLIKDLEDNGLDVTYVVSQGYDRVSVMSAHCTGAKQQIKKSLSAICIYCCAHMLNIVLVDCSKKVQLAHDFFCLLETLYAFMATSKAHSLLVATQKRL